MSNPTIFNQLLIWPFINLLIAFYKAISFLHLPGALGFAIIALTLVIRGALHPLTVKQMESARGMQKLKPHLDKLNKKHKKDKQRLQKEQLKLYQKHGINPAAGCLPTIIQFPILIALYRVFWQLLSNNNLTEMIGQINKIVYFSFLKIQSLDVWFFGLNLASKPSQWQKFGFYLLAIPVITALLQYYQTKIMMPTNPVLDKKPKGKEKEDMASQMQKQMSFMMPLMIGFFAYSFPVGLSLYWNTFTIFAIISQRKINNG